jgi:hypothetical protein
MLESVNLFPFTGFLRVKREPEVNHKCGGLSSLIIIVILVSLLIMKLTEAINRTSVTFISNSNVSL